MNSQEPYQHLFSYTGGSNMLEATTDDPSYGHFAAEADDTYMSQASSSSRNSFETVGSHLPPSVEGSPRLNNNARSPQLAPGPSPHGVSTRFDFPSGWTQPQPGAANNSGRAFSSSCQGPSLGHGHQSQLEVPTGRPVHSSLQSHGSMGQALLHGFSYPNMYPFRDPGGSLPDLSSLQRSSQLYVDSPLSNGLITFPVYPPGPYTSYSLPNPKIHSRQSSQGTPSVVVSSPGGLRDAAIDMTDMTTLNHPIHYDQNHLVKKHLRYDTAPQGEIEAIGSADFPQLVWQSSPSVEPSTDYSPSEAGSSSPSQGARERSRRLSDSCAPVSGTIGSRLQDRSRSTGLHTRRRVSAGQVPILPRPQHRGAAERSSAPAIRPRLMPKKPRGKRTGPLGDGRREAATRRRNERTVCIGCKMAKVMCDVHEDGKDCKRCASSHSSAPKPFVCVSASFFEYVQQGSTGLLALHTIYPRSSAGFRQSIDLPTEIHIRGLLESISELRKWGDVICVYGARGMLYELDLHLCWHYINATCSPVRHPFQQFINGLKVQKQDTWRLCIRDGDSRALEEEKLCDTLLALDDVAPWVSYTLRRKMDDACGPQDNGFETTLFPDNMTHLQAIIVAAQLSRIIGRKLELQFYDYLKKALANPMICRELVLEVGRTLMSLRRRLSEWTTYYLTRATFPAASEPGSRVDEDGKDESLFSSSTSRLKHLCQVLYVYFCYMRRRLPQSDREGIQSMKVLYPGDESEVEENFPQFESISGFEEWLQFQD